MRISDWSSDVCSSDLDGRAKRLVIKLIILAITIDANTRSGGERYGERERGINNRLGIDVRAILLSRDPDGQNVRYDGQIYGAFTASSNDKHLFVLHITQTVEREHVVEGTRVSVGEDLGGRRTIKK